MSSVVDQKKLLRQKIRERIASQSTDYFVSKEMVVAEKLWDHPRIRNANTILSYWSLPNETPTHALNLALVKTKQILLPVIDGDDLYLSEFQPDAHMSTENVFGISEPTGKPYFDYEKVDLVIVPGLAFDHSGKRCGKGKGYYDKTLVKLMNAYKIGLCFSFQIDDNIPVDEHDVIMDEIICIYE